MTWCILDSPKKCPFSLSGQVLSLKVSVDHWASSVLMPWCFISHWLCPFWSAWSLSWTFLHKLTFLLWTQWSISTVKPNYVCLSICFVLFYILTTYYPWCVCTTLRRPQDLHPRVSWITGELQAHTETACYTSDEQSNILMLTTV